MEINEITCSSAYWDSLVSLFNVSFPRNERMDSVLDGSFPFVSYFAFVEDDRFLGFLIGAQEREIYHILYFAVEEVYRCKGNGTLALRLFLQQKEGFKIMLDVEMPHEGNKDFEVRNRRIVFYKRIGFLVTDVSYRWAGEDFLMLSYPSLITRKRWAEFWDRISKG